MIVLITICVLIWFVWGTLFDPEPKLGPVERVLRHPGRWSRRVIEGWIKDAEDVLRDPASSEEEKEKAMIDIDYFSGLIGGKKGNG